MVVAVIGFDAEGGELSDGVRLIEVNSDAIVTRLLREGVLENSERNKEAEELYVFHDLGCSSKVIFSWIRKYSNCVVIWEIC